MSQIGIFLLLENYIYRKKSNFVFLIEMQYIEIPELPTLRGENAVKALYEYIRELEEQRNEGLTKKQTKALIKLAQGLISAIETERRSAAAKKKIKSPHLVAQLKKTILKRLSEPFRATENSQLLKKL
jgi:GMP synthase PP-ATPase subunit